MFGDVKVDVVDNYKYLGTVLNYNGSYVPNIKSLSSVATTVMCALLPKGCKLSLDVDTMLHLFDTMIKPILLYTSEVWGYGNTELIECIQLRFFLMVLRLNKNKYNGLW